MYLADSAGKVVSGPLLVAVSMAYLWVAIGYVQTGRWGMALAFVAYALANFGFMLDLRRV